MALTTPDINGDNAVNALDLQQLINEVNTGESEYTSEDITQLTNFLSSSAYAAGGSMNWQGAWDNFISSGWEYEETDIVQSSVPPSMESTTSVSNLGTVNYSGTTNWNAVPGGFQPLPQTAGNRKKLYQISQFHGGVNQRSSPRDIADFECEEAKNLSFNEIGRITVIGNAMNENNSITFASTTNNCLPGYGLFQFTAPADSDGVVSVEHINIQANRDFSGASNWTNRPSSSNWDTYDEEIDEGATEGDYFTDNYLKLAVTSDASNTKTAYLDGVFWEDAETGIPAMVTGRRYRLSYSMEITAYTSGTLSVGFGHTSTYVLSTDKSEYEEVTGPDTKTLDFVYDGATNHGKLLIEASTSSAFTVFFDNFSIKEVKSERVITLLADGDQVDAYSSELGASAGWIDMAGTDTAATAPIFYASNNGVYVCDTSYLNTPKAKIFVNRDDDNESVTGWVEGKYLIDAPDSENLSNAAASKVTIQSGGTDVSASNAGSLNVNIHLRDVAGGTWDGEYFFYVSWLFDGRCETQLTPIGTETFDEDELQLNPSLVHQNSAPLGGDKRIEGARIYFKKAETKERYLLAEFSLIDGVRGVNDTTFTAWTIDSHVHDLADTDRLIFDDPPEIRTYFDLNQYYANELYAPSGDLNEDDDAGITAVTGVSALALRYKTVTTGPQGVIYIGNVEFNGRNMPDTMMCSMPGRPGVFPQYNTFDSASSDGSPIRALASFGDQILQFKENGLYVIDVSSGSPNTSGFFTVSAFRNCGVFNPCQVFTTSFGVLFVNKFGVFIYDGSKVVSLTGGKFDWITQSGIAESISNTSDANVPSIGYDPFSQDVVVLKNIGDDASSGPSWIYSMQTQSWTEGLITILKSDGIRFSNFIITSGGYLSHKSTNDTALMNYNHVPTTAYFVTYLSKDLDFGLPSQTKKIMKVYITYRGDGSNVSVKYGYNGSSVIDQTMTNSENDAGTLTNAGTTDLQIGKFTIDSHPSSLVSIQLKIYSLGTEAPIDFEINDIAILYRPRPIK